MFKTLTIIAALLSVLSVGTVGYSRYSNEPILGLAVLKPVQGGTGVGTAAPSDVGKVLKVSDDSPFTFTLQDDNTGAGGSFPWTPASWGNSTSTVIGNTLGFFGNGSSTFNLLRSQHATSTNLNITGLLTFNGVTGSTWASFCTTITGGAGLCDGTDDTGGAGNTDTVLWANASTSPWTVSSLRALSSSTIAFLDITRATSTDFFSTNATTSFLRINTGLSFGGVSGDAWSDFCTSITGGSGLCDGTDDTGGGGGVDYNKWATSSDSVSIQPNVGQGIIVNASSSIHVLRNTYASSTYSSFSMASTTELQVSRNASTSGRFYVGPPGILTTSGGPMSGGVGFGNATFACNSCGASGGNLLVIANFGTGSNGINTFSARGTHDAPSATQSGDSIYFMGGRGYGATTWNSSSKAVIQFVASQTHTDSASGTYITLETTPNDTTSRGERVRVAANGAVGIGTTSPQWALTVSSSSAPQLALTDGSSTQIPWTFRSIQGNFYLATSTPSTFATSGVAALSIDSTGTVSFGNKLATCIALTGSAGLCDGDDATGGGGSTDTVEWAEASTSPWSVLSLTALSSSSIAFLDSVRATSTDHFSTNSTSTFDYISSHLRVGGTVRIDNLTSALVLAGSTGLLSEYTGIDCTNQFVRDVSAAGAGTCATITSADVDLADLTATNATLTFSGAYDGQTARTVGLNLGNANDWTALQTFDTAGLRALASSTIAFLDSTRATSTSFISTNATTTHLRINTGLSFGGVSGDAWTDFCTSITGGAGLCDGTDDGGAGSTDTVLWANASTSPWVASSLTALSSSTIAFLDSVRSTSTDHIMTNATTTVLSASSHIRSQGTLRVDGLTSALTLTGSGGLFAEYTGAACTNQVIEDLDALGAPTCVSINNGYWSGTDLSVANGGTGLSTFGGVNTVLYTTAADALSSEAAFTYDPATNLLSVDNLAISATGSLVLPATADPTVNAAGELALDTTSGNIIFATSTAQELVLGGATTTLYAFTIASTSPDFASGGVIPLPAHFLKQQAVGIICKVDGGTSQQIFLSDSGSTNDTNIFTCSTTETQYTFTANNIWTAYEPIQLEFATKSGAPDYITIRIVGFRTSD